MKLVLTIESSNLTDINSALEVLNLLAGTPEGDTCSAPDTGTSDADTDTDAEDAAADKKAAAATKRKAAREKKKVAEEAEKAEEEAAAETKESSGPSRDDVRKALKEYAALEGKTAAIQILTDNGAASIGELDEANYADIIEACGG